MAIPVRLRVFKEPSPVLSRNCMFDPSLDRTSQVARPTDVSTSLAERRWDLYSSLFFNHSPCRKAGFLFNLLNNLRLASDSQKRKLG
jgi:hypothetical protein